MIRFDSVQAIIFDHDGTLVDSEPVHLKCWQSVLAPFQKTLSALEYSESLSGIPSIDSATWLMRKFNLDTTANALLTEKQSRLNQYLALQACPLMEDVKEVLQYLKQRNIPLGVASGAGSREVQRSLSYHDLEQYFICSTTKDDVQNNKPSPDVYLLAAEKMGFSPRACLAIEDSDSGQRSALAAGMQCLRLDTISQLEPDPRCQKISNLAHLLQF